MILMCKDTFYEDFALCSAINVIQIKETYPSSHLVVFRRHHVLLDYWFYKYHWIAVLKWFCKFLTC